MLLQKIREKDESVWEKGSLFVWLFDICGLQFGIVREVCCHLVLVLRFGDLLSLGALQLLDLICGSLFDLCAILIWYLWPLVRIWFFGFVFVRESSLGVFRIWVCGVPLHQFVLSQICYGEICSSSPVDVGYCWNT